jgi:hypothetical protein
VSAAPGQVFVLDRSHGRHRALAALVPGAVYLPLGLDHDAATVISPWDVDDPGAVPAAKIAFLARLHGLLVAGREPGTQPLGLPPLERTLLTIAIRDVYARAADDEGTPSSGFLRDVLDDLARQERADPLGSEASAVAYGELSRRLRDICAGGRFGYLLDRPTRLDADEAPLVVIGTAAVPDELSAVVALTVLEFVGRLAERSDGREVTLLADALDLPPFHPGEEQFPPAFARDSILNGLHESYLRRRIRAGEARAIAYLHAMSDVAYFLHPPTTLAGCQTQVPP